MSNDTKYVCKINLKSIYHRRTLTDHSVGVKKVAISPDGSHAVSADAEGKMKFWDLITGNCIRTIKGSYVFHSNDRRHVLSYETDPKPILCLLDIPTGERVKTFEKMFCGIIKGLSPDCKYAVCSVDKKLQLWELSTGKCIRNFGEEDSSLSAVSFSDDGQWLYCGGNDSIGIWHMSRSNRVRTFKTPHDVSKIITHPNGKHLFTAGSFGSDIYLWDIATGKLLNTFNGQRGYIASFSLSMDGKYLFSGSGDNTVWVWDVNNKNFIILRGHTQQISSISLSCDSKWLLSSSDHYQDKTIRLWELDWESKEIEKKDWDEGAKSYLETFLTLCCKYGEDGLSRIGKPVWNKDDFEKLIMDLRYRGYGWLRPEELRKKLEEMTANWQGPPPLPGQ
jgi:WD40 repeat protein